MKRYFFDTEFLDDATTRTIELISIAIVCDDGRELYLGNSEFDRSRADDWLNANVMPQLPPVGALVKFAAGGGPFWRTRDKIRDAITEFVRDESTEQEPRKKPEFWAFYASYDWVIFCQLYGKMIDLPKHFPWLVNDLKTWAGHIGFVGSFKDLLPTKGHHDALEDARWNRDVHKLVLERVAKDTFDGALAVADMFNGGAPNNVAGGAIPQGNVWVGVPNTNVCARCQKDGIDPRGPSNCYDCRTLAVQQPANGPAVNLDLQSARDACEVEVAIKHALSRLPLLTQKNVLERVAVDVLMPIDQALT